MSESNNIRIGLISNRNSGHNRDRLGHISDMISRCETIDHIITDSVDDIPGALERFAGMGIEYLAINGGDGTASLILGQALESQLFPALPTVILLPGGTANMNAGDIGVRGSLTSASRRFCDWAQSPSHSEQELQQRVLLRVEPGRDAQARYGMFLGAGAVIHGTEYAHREIHSRGLRDDFSLALGLIRTLWGVFRDDPVFNRHVNIEVELDCSGHVEAHDTLILAISSLHRLFMGMRPFWGEEDGAVRVTVFKQHAYRFLRTFFSIARGAPNRNAVPEKGYLSHNTNHITLTMDGSLNLDGEIVDVRRDNGAVVITPTPAFSFLRL